MRGCIVALSAQGKCGAPISNIDFFKQGCDATKEHCFKDVAGKETSFLRCHFILKAEHLPRQARDK